MSCMFTEKSEYELYNYRLQCRRELLSSNEVIQNELYVRIIKLFYAYQLASSFYKVNINQYLTEEDIRQLLTIYSKEINELYFGGKYYSRYETSYYGYPLVSLEQSTVSAIRRRLQYAMNYNTQKELVEMLKIILTDLKSDFMGDDVNPTTPEQQFEILKSKLVM